MRSAALLTTVLLVTAFVFLPVALAKNGGGGAPGEAVQGRSHDAHGRVVEEWGVTKDADGISFHRWFHQAKPENPGNGNGGGKGGGGGGDDGGPDPGTDCESDKFKPAGWTWASPFSAWTTSYPTQVHASLQAWDDATSGAIYGSLSLGAAGVAGVFDGVNQFDWVQLGASTTIAVTTTWYYTSTGEAVESDAQYNTYYAWSTDGSANAMDVANIVTHEVGHTFGLDHPNGNPRQIGCLTMYAYAGNGETAKATLGDGDIFGIQALYG